MPNHCANELIVTGPTEEMKRFKDFSQSEKNKECLIETMNFIEFYDKTKIKPEMFHLSTRHTVCGTKWGCYDFEKLEETKYK